MFSKWCVEWAIKNVYKIKIRDKAEMVKKKLKIDERVGLVKDSIKTLKNKKDINNND